MQLTDPEKSHLARHSIRASFFVHTHSAHPSTLQQSYLQATWDKTPGQHFLRHRWRLDIHRQAL
jgi:hypothetical protein